MSTINVVVVGLSSFMVSWLLVGVIRRYALRADIVDVPNDRTLHEGRVARGGGLAVVLLVLGALVATTAWAGLSPGLAWPLGLVTFMLAALGWTDDRFDLPVAVRFLVHFVAAGCAIAWFGTFESVTLGSGKSLSLGVLAVPVSLLWIVWMANLYNFMDGSDGLAAIQGMTGSAAFAVWFYWAGDAGLSWVCLVMFSALGGFLVWNWAPAKVFMGDVGSITLGGVFAVLSVVAVTRYDMPVLAPVTLFLVFIGDATLTLLRRVARRERFWRPHRSHYYQRAVQSGMSHARVAVISGILMILVAVLATLSVAGELSPLGGIVTGAALVVGAMIGVNRAEAAGK